MKPRSYVLKCIDQPFVSRIGRQYAAELLRSLRRQGRRITRSGTGWQFLTERGIVTTLRPIVVPR